MEEHRNLIMSMQQWANEDSSLLAMTNEVDYDQDGNDTFQFLSSSHVVISGFPPLLQLTVSNLRI